MIMNKIIFLFCCFFFCSIQTKADDRQGESQFTIKFVEQPLDSALVQLAKESGYRFVFQDNITNKHTKVNQSFENKTISQILNTLLASTDYSYAIVYSSVVIYEKKIEQNSRVIQKKESKPFLIKGKIVDRENGDELWGTTVYIKGDESVGTVAKKDGTFSIYTTNPNALLIVVSIGYYPQVVSIKDAGLIKLEQTEESKKVVIIG
ncbi:hypothetical protein FQ707_03640 [Bacteroidaceae bacterium HV4-6-C5C]|jgi:magnesium-transporting ATPase (P-type)|nr:hypothetical protein FQ707_03640 [Bacteroidaceae bacterium HV4-6-C5C]